MDKRLEIKFYNATLDYKLKNNIELVQLVINYKRDFSSNRGKLTINLETALKAWNLSDFKKFNDFISMSEDPYNNALYVHDYIVFLADYMQKEKEKLTGNLYASDRKKYEDFINRLVKFNEILTAYGIESINIETAPKYKKCDVFALIKHDYKYEIEIFSGYSFNYNGYTLHVYDNKKQKEKYILVPSCGLAIASFRGPIKSAHLYLDNVIGFLKDPSKQKQLADCENNFNIRMNEAGHINNYDSIVIEPAQPVADPETVTNNEKQAEPRKNSAVDKRIIKFVNSIIRDSAVYKTNHCDIIPIYNGFNNFIQVIDDFRTYKTTKNLFSAYLFNYRYNCNFSRGSPCELIINTS